MALKKHLIPVEETKEPVNFADSQLKVLWLPDEVKVEKDVQDVLVNFTEAERHGVITTLKLFSLYETHAGSEYWGNRFKKIFKGSEFHRMASVFSMFELAIHGPFYNKINELLHLNTTEFYTSYLQNPTLKARIEMIGEIIDSKDDLYSLAGFSLVEGGILYSNFAFLKHFQQQGKNKLLNVVRGVNFSLRDENLHSVAGAWSFKHLKAQRKLTPEQEAALEEAIRKTVQLILEHETEIIKMIFEKGRIEGITETQLVHFVQSRLNECLHELGYKKQYEVSYNPIAAWFYDAINNYTFNDFFSGIGSQYHREWDSEAFTYAEYAGAQHG